MTKPYYVHSPQKKLAKIAINAVLKDVYKKAFSIHINMVHLFSSEKIVPNKL